MQREGDRTYLPELCPVELYQPREEGLILVCTKESSSGQGFPARLSPGAKKVPANATMQFTGSRNEPP